MSVSPQFQDDKRTETVFLCTLSPNAHRNCRPTVTTVSTMPTILLCLLCQLCPQMHIATAGCFEKSQDQIQRCRQQSWAFKQVERMSNCPWIQKIANNYSVKCVEKKVFDANGKITTSWWSNCFYNYIIRLQDFDLLIGVVGRHHSAPLTTFKNLASPKLEIVKGDFPVSEQQEEEKSTFSKLRCRLYSCLSSHQALMPLQLFIKQIALLSLLFVGRSTTWCPWWGCGEEEDWTRMSVQEWNMR